MSNSGFKVGDRVYWDDPDNHFCSKDGVIAEVIDGDMFRLEDGTEVLIEELTLLHRPLPVPECLATADGQFMVNMAHRYALGRTTSAPGSVTAWIRRNWNYLQDHTKRLLVEETLRELSREFPEHAGRKHPLGNECDISLWREFAEWGYRRLCLDDKWAIYRLFQDYRLNWPISMVPPRTTAPPLSNSYGDDADVGNSHS